MFERALGATSLQRRPWLWLLIALVLAGCDQLGLETPASIAAQEEAEGKAIGSACRHAGRAIEDCYVLNPDQSRSAIFNGWREMNDYMKENSIDVIRPVVAPNELPKPEPEPSSKKKKSKDAESSDDHATPAPKTKRSESSKAKGH